MKRPASPGREVQVKRLRCMRFTATRYEKAGRCVQRAAMYMVISKPKRKSWAVGVCQIIGCLLKVEAGTGARYR